MSLPQSLDLPHGSLRFPIYLPDATRGVVRGVDSADLDRCGIEALVMNTYHLMQNPGSSTIKALGGLHQMAAWDRPIITDSGGFQIYSLIRGNPKLGSLNNKGATFRIPEIDRKYNLTPEKSVQLQINYGADVVICLDDPTHVDDAPTEQENSVKRTVDWAARCRAEFDRLTKKMEHKPALFAVIQGGGDLNLRRQCAESLLEIGFDGYGYGGWPLDADGNLLRDVFAYNRELIPDQFPMHALGVGHPANVAACARLGYQIFDSAMPTRDARNGRLYFFNDESAPITEGKGWFHYIYMKDEKHVKSTEPLMGSPYSVGYLRHLFKINDTLFTRLATLHNLAFMAELIKRLREELHG